MLTQYSDLQKFPEKIISMEKKTNLNVRAMIDKTYEAFGKDHMQKIVNMIANFAVNFQQDEVSYSHITYDPESGMNRGFRRGLSAREEPTFGQVDTAQQKTSERRTSIQPNSLMPTTSLKKIRQEDTANILSMVAKPAEGTPKPPPGEEGLTSVNLVVPLNRGNTVGNSRKK